MAADITMDGELSADTHFGVHDSVDALPLSAWESVVPETRPLLGLPFLGALERSWPPGIRFRYVIIYRNRQPVAVAYFQIHDTSVDDLDSTLDPGPLRDLVQLPPDQPIRILLCGNGLFTGNHGFCFTEALTPEAAFTMLSRLMVEMEKRETRQDGPILMMAIKDLHPDQPDHADVLERQDYLGLSVEPAMIVRLNSDWTTFGDYLAAQSSKYRWRARDSRRKGRDLVRRSLGPQEIEAEAGRIQKLYTAVVERSRFRFSTVDVRTFVELKRSLGETYIFTAFHLEQSMVGFSTALLSPDHVIAHLIGLDYQYNLSHAIYLNMLFDFVELGIRNRRRSIRMGRTALEIKSSVGATAENLAIYIRHPDLRENRRLAPFARQLVQPPEWVPRNPFKRG